jgi:sec-independent protein translocase protein TatB
VFDLSTSKFFVLAVIALLVIGPKDLPQMLRTIGRYVGMIKRQAAEFRAQFDEAIKESEIADLKKQVEDFGREAETAMREAETSLQKEVDAVQDEANKTLAEIDARVQGERQLEAPASGDAAPPLPALEPPLPAPAADAALAAAVAAASPAPMVAEPVAEKVGA